MKRSLFIVSLAAVSAAASAQVLYSTNFDSYATGSVIGQDGWQEDTLGGYGPAQIAADPTGSGMGQVLVIDPDSVNDGGW